MLPRNGVCFQGKLTQMTSRTQQIFSPEFETDVSSLQTVLGGVGEGCNG
jgi:hypothetical protein